VYPVFASLAPRLTTSGSTSRAGRVSIPGWQERQPRVHPRRISTVRRSYTVVVKGTSPIWSRGSGVATRRSTAPGTPLEARQRRRPRRGASGCAAGRTPLHRHPQRDGQLQAREPPPLAVLQALRNLHQALLPVPDSEEVKKVGKGLRGWRSPWAPLRR